LRERRMEDETIGKPLISGDSREGSTRHDKSCMIPTILAIVFGVLFSGTLAGVVVLALRPAETGVSSSSSSPSPPSPEEPKMFKEYTAVIQEIISDPFGMHARLGDPMVIYSFGEGKCAMQSVNGSGSVTSRQFSAQVDGSVTVCQDMVNHANCYTVSSNSEDCFFSLKGAAPINKSAPCYELDPSLPQLLPSRALTKCDLYAYATGLSPETDADVIHEIIVESETGYPVSEGIKYYQDSVVTVVLYVSFNPEKPQDESVLQPFPGAKVYDFRTEEGNDDVKTVFTASGTAKLEFDRMRRETAVRKALHLPLLPLSQFDFSRIRSSAPQTIRDEIPDHFDAREVWKNCSDIIGTITNQDVCGSCWAMASSGVLSDRVCISLHKKMLLSPQYMVYCGTKTFGCHGGSPVPVWNQLMEEGTVLDDCIPFTARDGQCPKRCMNGKNITPVMIVHAESYGIPWNNTPETLVQAIQSEIMNYGPVQANFLVFEDFYQYNDGVYQRSKNAHLTGSHAVRIIGWGTDDDSHLDYWLVANSWGTNWGEGGFFKIRRGTNECNFEEQVIVGYVN